MSFHQTVFCFIKKIKSKIEIINFGNDISHMDLHKVEKKF